jgi:putative inorganic carbon (hco3(-)) transporter
MLRTILVFAILGGGIIASFFSRFAALILYLWFALFRPQEFMWYDISEWRISLIIGLLLVIPCFLTGKYPNITRPLSIGAIIFMIATLVAQLGGIDAKTGWIWMDYMLRLVLVSLLAVKLIDTPKRFLIVMAVIACSFGFHSAKAGLASLLGGGLRFSEGLAGSFIDNNGYALGIAMILPLLIATGQNIRLLKEAWHKLQYALYMGVILSAFAIVCTFSREGFLAMATGIIVLIYLQKRKFVILSLFLLIIMIAIPFIPIPKGYFGRIESINKYEEIQDESAISRFHFWRVAVDMALDHPFGIGLKGYEQAYDRYDFLQGRYGPKRSVHSSHFEVLAETGFTGAVIWFGMFAYAFYAAFRIRRRARNACLSPELKHLFFTCSNALIASMASFVVGGSFIALSLNDITWLTFGLVTSLDILIAAECTIKDPIIQGHTADGYNALYAPAPTID